MKLNLLIASFCFVTFLYSCKGKTSGTSAFDEEDQYPIVLSLETINKEKGEELLSTLDPEITYIALETKDESIIRGVSKVAVLENGNFVISDNQTLHLFSPTGKHIREVSQRGNGPADYNRIWNIVPNHLTGGFFIGTNRKVIEFDAGGEYINNFETPQDRLMEMVCEPDGSLLCHKMNVPKSPEDTVPSWFLFRYNTQGVELKRFEDLTPRLGGPDIITFITPVRPLYVYNEQVRFNELGNDTLFIVGEDKLCPYIIIDLGEMRMSASPKGTDENRDAVMNEMNEKLYLIQLMEDDNFFYMEFGWGFTVNSLFATYNKKSGQITNYGNSTFMSPKGGLTNDVDGGLPFYPKMIDAKGTRLMAQNALTFKEEILEKRDYTRQKEKYGSKFEKLYQLAESLEEDANPVMMMVRSK